MKFIKFGFTMRIVDTIVLLRKHTALSFIAIIQIGDDRCLKK
jgi:hypothetical protein